MIMSFNIGRLRLLNKRFYQQSVACNKAKFLGLNAFCMVAMTTERTKYCLNSRFRYSFHRAALSMAVWRQVL